MTHKKLLLKQVNLPRRLQSLSSVL
jgi:hypothetical protein